MAFRDDHDAAIARADALERELVALERDRAALAKGRRRPVDWRQLAPAVAAAAFTTGFTALALTLGWGAWWAGGGFVLIVLSLLALFGAGSAELPLGAVPVRARVELDGGRAVTVTALVRMPGADDAAALLTAAQVAFMGQSHDQVAGAAAMALELAVRAAWAGAAGVKGDAGLTAAIEPGARAQLARLGLVLGDGGLWVATR